MFKYLKIRTRLAVSFGFLALLMLSIATLAVLRLHVTATAFDDANHIRQEQLAPLYDIREALAQTVRRPRNRRPRAPCTRTPAASTARSTGSARRPGRRDRAWRL